MRICLIGAGRAAVLEVLERAQAHLDDLVGRLVVKARDEGDAAGVVLVARVVEACGLREMLHLGVPRCGGRGT